MASFYSEKIPPATVMHLNELASEPNGALCKRTVRVLGRVKVYDASRNMVIIEYRDVHLQVCVERLDGYANLAPGALVQFIGEFQSSSDVVLDARICRDMSTLNTDMFDRSLLIYRDFMARMNLKSPSTT